MILLNSTKLVPYYSFLMLLLYSFILSSCANDSSNSHHLPEMSRNEVLTRYCKYHHQDLSAFNQIVVINEIGTCINCNNIFAKAQGAKIQSDSTLFIVSGIGNKVDLSAYTENKSTNLIYDESAGFDTLNIVSSCAIITLRGGKIDHIENIDVNNVHNLSERQR